MKFYVLKHPKWGYLKSKEHYTCSWTDDIEKAKKWSYKNHPKCVINTSSRNELQECSIRQIFYEVIAESI